jgi:hypothetical protein
MNYIFPELAYYEPTWIPLLKAAREWIERRKCAYVCHALDFAAKEYEGSRYRGLAKEIEDLIASAIDGCEVVTEWPPASKYAESRSEQQDYRLAWIDHIIEECKRMKPLMESLDWKPCDHIIKECEK